MGTRNKPLLALLIDYASKAANADAFITAINTLWHDNPKLASVTAKPFITEAEQDAVFRRIVGKHGPRITRREIAQRLHGYAVFRLDHDTAIYFAIDRAVSQGFLTPEGDDGKAFTLSSPNARPARLPVDGNE
jgi:hypothetical protein